MAQQPSITDVVSNVRGWANRLATEVALLPDTLERLRDGATNFQLVGKRLAESSVALDEMTQLYTKTVGDYVRRSAATADTVQSLLERVPKEALDVDRLSAAASEIRQTLGSFASLSPFWSERRDKPVRREIGGDAKEA